METSQIITLVVAILGSSVLTALITLLFTRKKTKAETASIYATVHKTDAETELTHFEQLRDQMNLMWDFIPRLEASSAAVITCQKEKAEEQIKRREAEAERDRNEEYAESLRIRVAAFQKREAELMGELRTAREEIAGMAERIVSITAKGT